MGASFGISCRECDYTKDFITGIGMMYSYQNLIDFDSEFALLPALIKSKKTLAYIKGLLSEKNAVIAGYGHEIYHCPKCSEFFGRFYMHLDYDNGSFEVEYKCTKCKSPLKQIEYDSIKVDGWEEKKINLANYFCPKCGKQSLYEGGTVITLWD